MFILRLARCPLLYQGCVRSQSTRPSSSLKPTTKMLSKEEVKHTFGQPTAITHPHLIKMGELLPEVKVQEFQERRERLMRNIQKFAIDHLKSGQTVKNHLAIIPSSNKKYMSDKIPYVFRQNSDFLYLSGCLEPETILMLSINEKGNFKSVLFMRPKDKISELWDGPRTGVENAQTMFGVNEAYTIDNFQTELKRCIQSEEPTIWYDSSNSDFQRIAEDIRRASDFTPVLNSAAKLVQRMRLVKSPAEQKLMRQTCQIAADSINEIMRESRPGLTEHQIYAMVDYKCRMKNASYLAYPPVVASGANATTIHYINNSQQVGKGELVLMDAGCEYGGYTSDITRTWPIDGTFSVVQKTIYDVVLQIQKELLGTLLKEGGESLDCLFDTMCIKLGKYLQEVGLVSKSITDNLNYAQAGYTFCPHHVSHYLGMDVHDTPLISRTLPLKPGMVCTVEPGIYIPHDRADVPKEFRGLGVRIEDDVLITDDNKIEILTSKCMKERLILENLYHSSN